ncbi:MAG: ABC transporter substrate binding protein [Gammaproteobacteria bacterium]
MKGITRSGCLRLAGIILLILLGNLQPLQASGDQIVIVKSGDNSYFNQTIETLISHVEDKVSFRVIEADSIDANSALLSSSRLIIALGAKASGMLSGQLPKKFIVSAYVTQQQHNQLQLANINRMTVLLDQPLERYLAFTHFLFKPKAVGIINYSPIKLNRQQQNTLKRLGLRLNQYQSDNSRKLLGTVRQLVKRNDVLLMLPEQGIYNRNTLKGILLTAYRARAPVISYSPAHVKSGALASIYSSPADIGRHLAEVINGYTKGSPVTSGNTQFARYYSVAINSRVAHALGLELPDEAGLSQYLSEVIK